jgi:ribonuclease Z
VPDGPVRKDLAEGKRVVLADGRTIDSEDVLGPPEGRKKLVVVGDTETTDGLAELAATAGVKRLVLAHLSGRYTDEEILAEAVKIFPNSRVAADLDRLAV